MYFNTNKTHLQEPRGYNRAALYRHFTNTQSRMYVCMSFDYACRLLGV